MSFPVDSQDSRDPNSPQWGYVKVRKPEEQLQYPAKDKNWNEYVIFIHDQKVNPIEGFDPKTKKIPARTELECVMVPASLTIDCDQLGTQINRHISDCEQKLKACEQELKEYNGDKRKEEELKQLESAISQLKDTIVKIDAGCIPSEGKITIPSREKIEKNTSENKTVFFPDDTTVWVAWVVGPILKEEDSTN